MTQTGDPGTPIGEADSDPPDGILRLNRRRAGSRFHPCKTEMVAECALSDWPGISSLCLGESWNHFENP